MLNFIFKTLIFYFIFGLLTRILFFVFRLAFARPGRADSQRRTASQTGFSARKREILDAEFEEIS